MKRYEVQGKRINALPEYEALQKLRKMPPNAELIVWDGYDIAEISTVEDKIMELLDEMDAD